MKFHIYKSGVIRKEWRWKLKARNGEIIASGEGYKNRADCFYAIHLLMQCASAAAVVEG